MAKYGVLGISFDHMHMGDLLRQVAEHPDAEIAGIFDPDRARMQSAIDTFGIPEERVFVDLDACLAATRADLAIVCSATSAHADTVETIAPHGLHVMVEKPFAASVADARRMIEAMAESGRRLAINWPAAWSPPHNAAKRLIDEGAIGELIEIHYYGGNRGPLFHLADKVEVSRDEVEAQKASSWWYRKASGGGSLLDYLGYGTTLGTWYMGGRGADRGDERGRRDARHRGRPAFDHRLPLPRRAVEIRDALGHADRPVDRSRRSRNAVSCWSAATAASPATTTTTS